MVTEAINLAIAAGATTGNLLVRGGSAYGYSDVIYAVPDRGRVHLQDRAVGLNAEAADHRCQSTPPNGGSPRPCSPGNTDDSSSSPTRVRSHRCIGACYGGTGSRQVGQPTTTPYWQQLCMQYDPHRPVGSGDRHQFQQGYQR